MKHQDVVLQLMRNNSLYFVHPRNRSPVGGNRESFVAFSGDEIKATICHWPSSCRSSSWCLGTTSSVVYMAIPTVYLT